MDVHIVHCKTDESVSRMNANWDGDSPCSCNNEYACRDTELLYDFAFMLVVFLYSFFSFPFTKVFHH